jgi:hypothetical protein
VWLKSALNQQCFVRAGGDHFCRAYPLTDGLWRWEVLCWSKRSGRFQLQRLGTSASFTEAARAADSHVGEGVRACRY